MAPLQVFLLDDSLEMQRIVQSVVEGLGGELLSARSVEQAISMFRHAPPRIDFALIDLMLPLDNVALKRVDGLVDDRIEFCLTITMRGNQPDLVKLRERAKHRLDAIDDMLISLVADDGGLQFLESAEGRRVAQIARKVAVFSARRPDVVLDGHADNLRSRANKALGREFDEWFEKPVPVTDLEHWLRNARPD
jgi:CheY-like chemotaxis protein